MHALIVVSHPKPGSLTHGIAASLAEGVTSSDPAHSFEIADLAAEGFDPRFTANDLAVHLKEAQPSRDVTAEQARIDRADALALVYPVYWWSMPGLLKGWIDRVFTNGWAYEYGSDANAPHVKKLRGRTVHLLGVAGADAGTYQKHGYAAAMKTQIDHGIFDYCGATVRNSTVLLDSHGPDAALRLASARAIGHDLFAAATQR